MQRRRFLHCLATGALSCAAPVAAPADAEALPRGVRLELTFSNPYSHPLSAQRFYCYLPAHRPPSQSLAEVRVSMAHRIQSDRFGHRILALEFDAVPALKQIIVQIKASVEMGRQDGAAPAPAVALDEADWLAPERYIESDAAPIRELAARLKGATDAATVRAIYDWLRANLRYAGYLPQDLGALQGLLTLRGDCTEYADLAVALARANRLPARMLGGYVADGDLAPRPQDYHNWAEVYVDGRWLVLDAQKGNDLVQSERYIAYRIYRDGPSNEVGAAHRYRMDGQLQLSL